MAAMDRKTGKRLTGEAEIRQALDELATTVPGDRVMMGEYGSGLHTLVDVGVDSASAAQFAGVVSEDVKRWEPRVRVDRVKLSVSPDGTVRAASRFVIRESGASIETRS